MSEKWNEKLRSNPNLGKKKPLPTEEEREGFFPWAITDENGKPLYMNPETWELEELVKEDPIGDLIEEVERDIKEKKTKLHTLIKNLENSWWSITRWEDEVTFSSWFKKFSITYDTPLDQIEKIIIKESSTEA
jgi:hypothetical protein